MKSPKEMKIIQIEITNACSNRCANCTRFCGHHQKPFFMDLKTFKKAVDSMKGFSGIVGIMGGEPTLHPEFDTFVRYFKEHFGLDESPVNIFSGPESGFIDYICKNKFNIETKNQRGLWSSMGHRYYKYFELIQDTFGYQALNDHSFSSLHETLMVTRKELGIPDKEWYLLRDNCWIQSLWSASITPKGAFFCEVAAALDLLFDGPGGWPIEPGWWLRDPSNFGDQLRWCELCSAPLPMPKRDANKEIDDASPVWCNMLEKIQSPKFLQGKVNTFNVSSYNANDYSIICESLPYLQDQHKRLANGNGGLEPRSISIWMDLRNSEPSDCLDLVQKNQLLTKIDLLIISNSEQEIVLKSEIVPTINLSEYGKEANIFQIAEKVHCKDFIIILSNYYLKGDPRDYIQHFVFNPGCYYYYRKDKKDLFSFFSLRASSLLCNPEFVNLQDVYPLEKQVNLESIPDITVKIFQACHKPSTYIKNEIFQPIQLGKEISNVPLGILGDNTGDNISEKNVTYAELTGLYWMWKNDKVHTYLGLCHYRRILIFNPSHFQKIKSDYKVISRLNNEQIKDYGWIPDSILNFVVGTDIIVPRPWKRPMRGSQKNHYKIMHGPDSYNRLCEGIKIHAPDYYPYLQNFFNGKDMITGHMFVMRREILDAYCNWLFPLLEKIYPNTDFSNNNVYNIREPAFAAERLFHIYIEKLKKNKPELVIKEVPWIMIEDTSPNISSLPALDNKFEVIPIVSAFDNNFAPIYSVFLESLISTSSSRYHYDLIILSDLISDEHKKRLISQIKTISHISIRFFEMNQYLNKENLEIEPHFSKSTFFRLKLPSILPEYNKIIYIDPDVIIREDISEIFFTNLNNCYAGVVRCLNTLEHRLANLNVGIPYNNLTYEDYFINEVGLNENTLDNYFNAGFMLLNLHKIREENLEEMFLKLYSLKNFFLVDQDILNKSFNNKIIFLEQRWNVVHLCKSRAISQLPYKYEVEYQKALENPAIIHYAAPYNKPWLNDSVPFGEIFWMYARKSPYYEVLLKQFFLSNNKSINPIEKVNFKKPNYFRDCAYQKIRTNNLFIKSFFTENFFHKILSNKK
ncbi:DUF4422 domain-containing protein [uncultured Methanospirillum sp.]|uniref:DUF4422 domain-containing protein n=1 Tax=uncultured Methanospirillum sp. TaxID=262503 RepID=UPI0029C6FA69|nr:DUF4422 domain-containing protein [uncultured Methanospirillum sp.]